MITTAPHEGPHQVVTEGDTHALILRELLKGRVHDDRLIRIAGADDKPLIWKAGGYSSAISLARSMLLSPGKRIAVVLDADTRDPEEAAKRRRFVEAALEEYALDSQFRVFLAEPTIEAWLFLDPIVTAALLPAEQIEFLKPRVATEPRRVLEEVLGQNGHPANFMIALKELLDRVDLTPVTKHWPVDELVDYVLGKWAMKPVA
jgi:hypothetical protein